MDASNQFSFLDNTRPIIAFHKNCADGFFSAYLFLNNIQAPENFQLLPMSPYDIKENLLQINFNSIWAIFDLPLFTSNVTYYFDHHITNKNSTIDKKFQGQFNAEALSTCQILQTFFNLKDENKLLIEIANIIDQAAFEKFPPTKLLDLDSLDDYAWACNDLFKAIRNTNDLFRLWDDFKELELSEWIRKHSRFIKVYREQRQKSLIILPQLNRAAIMIIEYRIPLQSESVHFALSFEDLNLKITISLHNIYDKTTKKHQFRWTFRQNPRLTEFEKNYYRVDGLAKQFQGGGHKTVATAITNNKQSGLQAINKWLAKNKIAEKSTYSIIQ